MSRAIARDIDFQAENTITLDKMRFWRKGMIQKGT